MKYILLFFLVMIFSLTNLSFSQSGWIKQNSGTNSFLYCVIFTDYNTGYILADSNILLKTTDSGTNWIRNNLEFNSSRLEGMHFISSLTGWVYGSPGVIIKTTNGGENWFYQLNNLFNDYITGVYFISEITGWAVGTSNPAIIKTTNGGQNWFVLDTIKYGTFVHFISANTGFAGGIWGRIFKTTNGGNNWYMVEDSNVPHIYLRSVSFPSASIGWIAGNHYIYKTTNSGENWSYSHEDAYTIFFVNINTGWYAGNGSNPNGKILKTTDSGNNWFLQYSTDSFYFYSSFFVNSNTGWVIGNKGNILKTTNSGEPIGIKQISSKVPNKYVLYQNYPNPFNPITKIKFTIPPSKGVRGMIVRLVVYDILGREVASLIPPLRGGEEGFQPGTYEADWDAANYPSGVYFYKLIVTDASSPQANPLSTIFSETKKMVLMK